VTTSAITSSRHTSQRHWQLVESLIDRRSTVVLDYSIIVE